MSVKLKQFDAKKAVVIQKKTESELWTAPLKPDLIHQVIVRQQVNSRLGTACTKTRAEVRGGGRKPWRQKGTGRARAGSSRSPLWRGGGVSFGPRPRTFNQKLNRKMRRQAFHSALTEQREKVILLTEKELEFEKTRAFLELLDKLEVPRNARILVLAGANEALQRATRNLQQVTFLSPDHVGALELFKAEHILILDSALATLERRIAV